MSGLERRWAATPTTPYSVWKYNWLINHRIIAALRRGARHAHGVLLDVGCGPRPFERYVAPRVTRLIGVDLPPAGGAGGPGPDVYGIAEALPFRAQSFDTVLGLSISSYFTEPSRMLDEAHRVLKPGGVLMLDFAQMAPLYDAPRDFYRFTRFGATWLLERAGFDVVEVIPFGNVWAHAGHSVISRLNRLNRGPLRVVTEIPVRALYVVLQVAFDLLDRIWVDPDNVVSNLIVARRREAPVRSGP